MTKLQVEEILSYDLAQLYRLHNALSLEEGNEQLIKNRAKVRFGIKHHFDIHRYLRDEYKPGKNKNTVSIQGKRYSYEDFFGEIEEREALLLKGIMDGIKDEEYEEGRAFSEQK